MTMFTTNKCRTGTCPRFCTPSLPIEDYHFLQESGQFKAGDWMPCDIRHKRCVRKENEYLFKGIAQRDRLAIRKAKREEREAEKRLKKARRELAKLAKRK